LTCSKFLTTSDYAPRLRARLAVEQQLIDDATTRGWQREIERHTATKARIEQLLTDLSSPDGAVTDAVCLRSGGEPHRQLRRDRRVVRALS